MHNKPHSEESKNKMSKAIRAKPITQDEEILSWKMVSYCTNAEYVKSLNLMMGFIEKCGCRLSNLSGVRNRKNRELTKFCFEKVDGFDDN